MACMEVNSLNAPAEMMKFEKGRLDLVGCVCTNCDEPAYYLCNTCGKGPECCNCGSDTKRSDTEAG